MNDHEITNQQISLGTDGQFRSGQELMTEEELIKFLRIPEVSRANNHHHVIDNLKRTRKLPRLPICNKVLYPLKAILEWIHNETTKG